MEFKHCVVCAILFLASCTSSHELLREGREAFEQAEYREAVELLEPIGNRKPEAAYWIGRSFEELALDGDATQLNQASNWYRKAAAQNHVDAKFRLGRLLYFAGREQDGLGLIQSAAICGSVDASELLRSEDLPIGQGSCGRRGGRFNPVGAGGAERGTSTGYRPNQ